MAFKIVTDVKTGKATRVDIAADELGQDTPEQHAAKVAARAQEKSSAERIAALETAVAALQARAGK